MNDDRKAIVLQHFAAGMPQREIARVTGVSLPTAARWCRQARAVKQAAEAAARADVAFAANPAPLRVIPGGARAGEPAETTEESVVRSLAVAREQAVMQAARNVPMLAEIRDNRAAGENARINAAKAINESAKLFDDLYKAHVAGPAVHIDAQPDWWADDEDDQAGDAAPAAATGGVA